MDDLTISLARVPRRYPATLQLDAVGHLQHKRYRVQQRFDTMNFSLVLRGSGRYQHQGRWYRVRPPCVLTQWPDQACDYGPEQDWEECFLIYDRSRCPVIHGMGLYDADRPIWTVVDAAPLHAGVRDLRRLLAIRPLERVVDRIDRCAESLIVESLLSAEASDSTEAAVGSIRALVEADLWREHDFPALATEQGLSFTHFRRLWQRLVGCPPQRYLKRLRMEYACRLLAHDSRPVGEIATAIGFTDPLYFSRRFRAIVGETPTAFRRRSQQHLRGTRPA